MIGAIGIDEPALDEARLGLVGDPADGADADLRHGEAWYSGGVSVATCGQCGKSVPYEELTFTPVGSYCKTCHVAENKDSDKLERALYRSIGRRQLIVGIVMLAIGCTVLALGVAGSSQIMIIPVGMLVGGLVEIALGWMKLSSNP